MTNTTDIHTVVVIGAGIMGRGIAHVAAAGGFNAVLNDVSDDLLEKARLRIRQELQKGVDLGKLAACEMDAALSRLAVQTDLGRAVENADLVIEAVPER